MSSGLPTCLTSERPVRGGATVDGWQAMATEPESAFRRRVMTIGPDCWHAVVEHEWHDAIVVVERGEIELHCMVAMRRFGRGAVLSFVGLGLQALHNPGSIDTVLVATSRRRPAIRAPDP